MTPQILAAIPLYAIGWTEVAVVVAIFIFIVLCFRWFWQGYTGASKGRVSAPRKPAATKSQQPARPARSDSDKLNRDPEPKSPTGVVRERIIEREVLMVRCKHCEKVVRFDSGKCPECGARLEPM